MRFHLQAGLAVILSAGFLPLAAQAGSLAGSKVALSSAVFVERAGGSRGGLNRTIEPAATLARGQRLVLVVDWQAPRKTSSFTVTTPIPVSLSFQRSSAEGEEVSVNGGRDWGRLGALQTRDSDGLRMATPEDVTHVRWRVRSTARTGRIAYSALVR